MTECHEKKQKTLILKQTIMYLLSIHPIWLTLLAIAGIACFSIIMLSIGLFIGENREKPVKKRFPREKAPQSKPSKTPDIMGASRPVKRQSPPIEATERQIENREEKPPTFAREIPSKELDRVFSEEDDKWEDPDPDSEDEEVDLQDEETELQVHRTTIDETDFATGVSFDELQQVTRLIQKEELPPDEQISVTATAVKLTHTDLWKKVMNALPDANKRIAKMLDAPSRKVKTAEDWQSFDIRNFI